MYVTTSELTDSITSYNLNKNNNNSVSQQDNDLLMKKASGDIYLSTQERNKFWTITSPSQLQEFLQSKRDKLMGKEFCNKKRTTDDWGRPSDINSLDYYTCPGDDPNISINRENKISRLAYEEDYVYPIKVPYGLKI
jgi:hypothetical protein